MPQSEPLPQTIDEVIAALDAIVARQLADASPLGYFPGLYRRVTVAVAEAIERRAFDDNERMERLDILFANRYIEADRLHRQALVPTASWQAAFSAAANPSLTVLQHLLLGMNAHISLDLGIAAAACETNRPLTLKSDFNTINSILGSLVNDTQARLTRIFRPLGLLDRLLGPIDESMSIFSIGYARDRAWSQTLELALASPAEATELIKSRDADVARFAQCLVRPPKLWTRNLLRLVRLLERGSVAGRIQILNANR